MTSRRAQRRDGTRRSRRADGWLADFWREQSEAASRALDAWLASPNPRPAEPPAVPTENTEERSTR